MRMHKIPCAHEVGRVSDHTESTPDYHPLSKDEIEELLKIAQGDYSAAVDIQCRLNQAVRGMKCPMPALGQTVINAGEIDKLFVDNYKSGPTPQLVDRLYALMNW